jgi:hypothetical protein
MAVPDHILTQMNDYLSLQKQKKYVSCYIGIEFFRKEEYIPEMILFLKQNEFSVDTFTNRYNETVLDVRWNSPKNKTYTPTDLRRIYEEHQKNITEKEIILQSFMTTLEESILQDVRNGLLEKHVFPEKHILEEWYPDILEKLKILFPFMKTSIEWIDPPNSCSYIALNWNWRSKK